MPYRKEQFVNNEIYHVVLRAIDDNVIFKNQDDYYRGIFSLYEFNNINPTTIRDRREARLREKNLQSIVRNSISRDPLSADDKRDKLVEVLSFCLMPNHPHLLLRQIRDGGITKFMMKFGAGYGGYFNRKYNRKGHVFQNRFSSTHIKNDEQLKTVFVYIHTNPISLIEPKWKEKGIKDPEKVIKFLENYKWSSYQDYIKKKNFPSVTERGFILKTMGGEQKCKEFVEYWVKYKEKIKKFPEFSLEE